ncbi:MAG: LPS export ABC transporter periplasmic protein LptC [Wenzhouxiangellaceae bacterium]|nr:LPS export ABC transporter periplasmic protein LptC [Wenzhouxiangellaceae bacterium]
MSRRRLWTLAVATLLALVGVQWWLADGDRDAAVAVDPGAPRIDYALVDFELRTFDERGRPDLRLSGPELRHEATTRTAIARAPSFELADGWSGSARRATLDREAGRIRLTGNVLLQRPHPRGTVFVESEEMIVDRPAGTIVSPGAARIEQAGTNLTGGTLTVRVDEQRMELDNHVEAIYRAGLPGRPERVD